MIGFPPVRLRGRGEDDPPLQCSSELARLRFRQWVIGIKTVQPGIDFLDGDPPLRFEVGHRLFDAPHFGGRKGYLPERYVIMLIRLPYHKLERYGCRLWRSSASLFFIQLSALAGLN